MIVVTGATGNIGAELVRALADAGEEVRALVRGPGATDLPEGVAEVVGDLDVPASVAPALAGARGVFLLPGYRDMPGLLAEARRAGVEHVVQLSGGSAAAGIPDNAVSRYMIRSETAVRESGVAWTIVRPVSFMSNTFRWLPQLRDSDMVRDAFGDVPVAAIDPFDIAAVAAEALLSDGHEGRVYPVTGPESLLPADRVRILGSVLGRALRFEGLSDDEARTEMSATMPDEYVHAFFTFFGDGALDESVVLPTVEDVTGRPPRGFAQWAKAHADAFR